MDLPGLWIPTGVVPQYESHPCWIYDYTSPGINVDTLSLAAMDAMQFGHDIGQSSLCPVQLLNIDLGDGFYHVNLNMDDIPKLGVVFPINPGEEPLIALPLVLLMGWKHRPPFFSTASETIVDLAN